MSGHRTFPLEWRHSMEDVYINSKDIWKKKKKRWTELFCGREFGQTLRRSCVLRGRLRRLFLWSAWRVCLIETWQLGAAVRAHARLLTAADCCETHTQARRQKRERTGFAVCSTGSIHHGWQWWWGGRGGEGVILIWGLKLKSTSGYTEKEKKIKNRCVQWQDVSASSPPQTQWYVPSQSYFSVLLLGPESQEVVGVEICPYKMGHPSKNTLHHH